MTLPLRKREETGNTKLFLKLRDTHLLDYPYYLKLEEGDFKEMKDYENMISKANEE